MIRATVSPVDPFPPVGAPVEIKAANRVDSPVLSRSKNLRGLTRYAFKNLVASAALHKSGEGEGLLVVFFENGAVCRVRFADFTVARGFARSRWKRWGLFSETRNSDEYWSFNGPPWDRSAKR